MFRELQVPSQTKSNDGVERTYYPESSLRILAEHLGIEPLTEDRMSERQLVDYYHELRDTPSRIPPARIRESMSARDVESESRFHGNLVVTTYPTAKRNLPLADHLRTRSKIISTGAEPDQDDSPLQRPFYS